MTDQTDTAVPRYILDAVEDAKQDAVRAEAAREEAEDEAAMLRWQVGQFETAIGRVQALRDSLDGDSLGVHVEGCRGQADCPACVVIDLDAALAGVT